jgi:hypothetical protein
MQKLWILVFVGLGIFGGGCASDPDKEFGKELMRIVPAEPPTFLTAEVASLFGAANFSARVEVQKGLPGSGPAMLGELSGRNGSLFFVADHQRGKRGLAGGLSALWHAPSQTAYLFNEPLLGYAPIRHSGTNGPVEVTQVGEEEMAGERCRKSVISNGAVPTLIVWRSIAKQDLPIRVQGTNSSPGVTVTLSRVRMEAPPPQLFELPTGFKAYASTDEMMSELVRRRTDAVTGSAKARREKYGTPLEDSEDQSISRPVRPY